jgi:hypothetical protein
MENTIDIHKVKITAPSSQREPTVISRNNQTSENPTVPDKKALKKWQKALIIVSIILFIVVVIAMVLIFIRGRGPTINPPEDLEPTSNPLENQNDNNDLSKKEALKAFEPNFEIASKTNHLNQVILKSNTKFTSISNGVESTTLSAFTYAKYDVFTLNESNAAEDSKEFYQRKYYTVITMNSICNAYFSNKTDCELKEYLNLNVKNKNLRNIDEQEIQEVIKKLIIPICIIEHTDTNIIISATCPETLSSNLKEDIILSFQVIKPRTFKGIIEDDSIGGTNVTQKDNKKYINSFIKGCDDYNGDLTINKTCEEIKNIVTDLNGNLISMKQNSTKEIIKDENHKNKQIKTYYIEDISDSENFDSNNYKKNLDNVFELIKSFMQKKDYISLNSFKLILENLMKGDSNTTNKNRRLTEEETHNSGIFKSKIFSKEMYGINIELNVENDIGAEKNSMSKLLTGLTTGKETKNISVSQKSIKLNETMGEFIALSKASKEIAKSLQEELIEKFLELRNEIDSNFNDLNNNISFADLLPIFDSSSFKSSLSIFEECFSLKSFFLVFSAFFSSKNSLSLNIFSSSVVQSYI